MDSLPAAPWAFLYGPMNTNGSPANSSNNTSRDGSRARYGAAVRSEGSPAHSVTSIAPRDGSRARRLAVHSTAGHSPAVSPSRGRVTAEQWRLAESWKSSTGQDPWQPCILALDGGGIRGFSSALILKELMHRIYIMEQELEAIEPTGEQLPDSEDELLPCHYFDFMYGTSTGGLIAVMLARLRMSIGDCLVQYRKVGQQLFGHRRTIIPFMTKYRSAPLVKAVQDLVEERQPGTLHPWDATEPLPLATYAATITSSPVDSRYSIGHTDIATKSDSFRNDSIAGLSEALGQEPQPTDSHDMEPPSVPTSFSGSLNNADDIAAFGAQDQSGPQLSPQARGPWWDPNAPRVCQSCCLTAIHNGSVQQAHLLRSYPHFYDPLRTPVFATLYNEGADPLEIWQVTRATSAAPFYFDMLEAEVDGQMRGHKDGGIRENNPALAAWTEFNTLYPRQEGDSERKYPALLFSVGTGRTATQPDGFMSTLPWPFGRFRFLRKFAENISVIPNLLVKYTESEEKHDFLKLTAEGENTWYKRLNVSSGMDNMPLDSWEKGEYHGEVVAGGASLRRMEDATIAYLSRDVDRQFESFVSPRMMIEHTAEKLVRVRRARRAMGGERWRFFIGEGLKERMTQTIAV